MRHHFGDLLDRDGDYWTIVPNRERYAHGIATLPEDGTGVTIVTLGKLDTDWRRVLALPDLVELTLHEPSLDQLEAIAALQGVRRLRVTHARPKDIDFIGAMQGLEEVVLEYVSGFSDLAPLGRLPRLRALHLENLRRVCSLGGLAGCATLRYLSVNGTCDWLQPVADFEFLRGLPALEVLAAPAWQQPAHRRIRAARGDPARHRRRDVGPVAPQRAVASRAARGRPRAALTRHVTAPVAGIPGSNARPWRDRMAASHRQETIA